MRIDLTGRRFGRLTVVALSLKSTGKRTYWLCQCDCGNSCEPRADALKPETGSGIAHSCGCLQREIVSQKGRSSVSLKPPFSAVELRDRLSYNPRTGVFLWTGRGLPYAYADKEAGSIEAEGYRVITIDGRSYKAHLLAWYYMTGEWPTDQIDHRDAVRSNNTWENLRPATNQMNQFNRGPNKNNRSGLKGVFRASCNRKRPWMAKIAKDGIKFHLGYFETAEAASAAYHAKAVQLAGEFANRGYN